MKLLILAVSLSAVPLSVSLTGTRSSVVRPAAHRVRWPGRSRAEQLGGKPATLSTAYKTEHAWAIRESVEDVIEIAAASRRSRTRPECSARHEAVDRRTARCRWLRRPSVHHRPGPPADPSLAEQYAGLADSTAASVVRAGAAVDAALRQNLRSARAHESAALALAAFGLREAVGDPQRHQRRSLGAESHDRRISPSRTPCGDQTARRSIDGQLARVAFLALSNLYRLGPEGPRSARGSAGRPALHGVEAGAPSPIDRRLAHHASAGESAAHREARVFPRAPKGAQCCACRRGIEPDGRAGGDRLRPHRSGFLVTVWKMETPLSTPSLAVSCSSLSEGLSAGRAPPAAIDPARCDRQCPTRTIDERGTPRVIPWGAWAQFFQRHIGLYLGQIDHHYRLDAGLQDRADQLKPRLDALLGHLTLFPIACVQTHEGTGNRS